MSGSPEIDSLNSVKYLYLRKLSEPTDNSLRIVVQEAIDNHSAPTPATWSDIPELAENDGGKKYVSLNLVYFYWANLRGYREIGDARAHNDLLDDRARHHRINHRRRH